MTGKACRNHDVRLEITMMPLIGLVLMLAIAEAQGQAPTKAPQGSVWPVEPDFAKNADARKNISGAACASDTNPPLQSCLAANDEKKYAQFFSVSGNKITTKEVIRLLPSEENGIEYGEIDAEGVAYDRTNGYFYVTGSHGAARGSGEIQVSRFFVFRFPVNKQTGRPEFAISADEVAVQIEKSTAFRRAIKNAPEIAGHAEQPLGSGGANVEGIAVRDGRIFLGLRAPSLDRRAYIVSASIDDVFPDRNQIPKAETHFVELGENMGIRDMAQVGTGILILSGPASDAQGEASVFYWDGKSSGSQRELARLNSLPAEGKAETLLVLDEKDPNEYRVLVMFDGIKNGYPREYRIPK